jgi:hypothetical protein
MAKQKRLPYIKWFASDFAGSTRGWPFCARALYRELLDAQWDMGGLPNDEGQLRRIAGLDTDDCWVVAWPFVRPKFDIGEDGKLRNAKLEQLREDAGGKSETNSENGRKGGQRSAEVRREKAAAREQEHELQIPASDEPFRF